LSVLLDTHVWLWWLIGQSSLPERERMSLDLIAARRELCLSAISLWEAQMLHAKRRIELPLPFAEWLRRAAAPGVVRVLPLDTEVVIALDALPVSFHGDPADRLIVATARVHRLPLATHDDRIRRSRVVRTWRAPSRRRAPLLRG
jgi:PIN domain nuclease of toxin-antitoxin system